MMECRREQQRLKEQRTEEQKPTRPGHSTSPIASHYVSGEFTSLCPRYSLLRCITNSTSMRYNQQGWYKNVFVAIHVGQKRNKGHHELLEHDWIHISFLLVFEKQLSTDLLSIGQKNQKRMEKSSGEDVALLSKSDQLVKVKHFSLR